MNGRVRRGRVASVIVAAVAAAAIAVPGSALAFDHHFSVISKNVGGHRTNDGFSFRIALLNIHNDRNQVGRGHGVCKFRERARKVKCKVVSISTARSAASATCS